MPLPCFATDADHSATTLTVVKPTDLEQALEALDPPARAWATLGGFRAEPGQHQLLPAPDGSLGGCLVGADDGDPMRAYGGLPMSLPAGTYALSPSASSEVADQVQLGWGLGAYRFDRYKSTKGRQPALLSIDADDRRNVHAAVEATWLVRDLINTPAEDMTPVALHAAAKDLADAFGATFSAIVGEDLLEQNFPAVHAVGRASPHAPRLLDFTWGDPAHPKVTIVGKGVCFDTGGLDIKPAGGMLNMKKDMGGGAHALGLARMIMASNMPVRLRVLIPAVENVIAGNSFKPLDIIRTRKGLSVEIGNTDAEGRVVLADALCEADSESPDIIVDFATLTGAARVALGADLPAFFCSDDDLAARTVAGSMAIEDPIWRMPLWAPYRKLISSTVADINNAGESGMGGAITAALFLRDFVSAGTPWMHLDTFAWNAFERPGRPKGGEALGMRAVFAALQDRYSAKG
ncbi:leucyl aminopeptidase family protein [Fodinicurvata sp. EGI_FJ10296]|uniref:leucyl aminopeptidase family protein n=1 Tax=Fodinicurvata sp. EGI_FJ10296 TaxID=3231908 RepID=UPI003454B466